MPKPTPNHYLSVAAAFRDRRVVPFLGAGVNLCGRPAGKGWELGTYLPSGSELSTYLADHFQYQTTEPEMTCPACKAAITFASTRERQDLVRVSQFVALDAGLGALYERLHAIFDKDYPPTALHNFLAKLPAELNKHKMPEDTLIFRKRLVILTTNYDDVLERAFSDSKQKFHLVTYMADIKAPNQRGNCLHWLPGANQPKLIDKAPNDYTDLIEDEYPVIVKIHGATDRADSERDSYVITEDHYIDYLTRADISKLLPQPIPAILKKSSWLFLGYGLRDMNLRVILKLIQREQTLNYNSWAVQLNPQPLDEKFWQQYRVDILDVPLDEYVQKLDQQITALSKGE